VEPPVSGKVSSPGSSNVEGGISLHMMESGQILSLSGHHEFTIGRATEGQPILPDVDLTNYDAFSQGVSRLHAALRVVNSKLVVIDLGSANGTRVNGQKILPHIEYPLNHGDVLALGKLKIQVLFRK
jgi:pSer/pThr/pTyr-binding forkhead associated (FHA) protein